MTFGLPAGGCYNLRDIFSDYALLGRGLSMPPRWYSIALQVHRRYRQHPPGQAGMGKIAPFYSNEPILDLW